MRADHPAKRRHVDTLRDARYEVQLKATGRAATLEWWLWARSFMRIKKIDDYSYTNWIKDHPRPKGKFIPSSTIALRITS